MRSRQFIRHPSEIPIEFTIDEVIRQKRRFLKNVSQGGLCFMSDESITVGSGIEINISLSQPPFEASGTVAWCNPTDEGRYEIGVEFSDESIHFTLRLVEQLCHIQQYKQDVRRTEGRELNDEEAAAEWISKYAGQFPQ